MPLCAHNAGMEVVGHVAVIINPHGGNGKARLLFEQACRPTLVKAAMAAAVHHTEYAGHAILLAATIDLGAGLMVVGGDGLLREVVTGLRRRSETSTKPLPPLAIVPGGSANALAHALYDGECNSRHCLAKRAALSLVCGSFRCIDLFEIGFGGDTARRYGLSLVGTGLSSIVAKRADHLRWLPGHCHYRYTLAGMLTVLGKHWPKKTTILRYPWTDDPAETSWKQTELESLDLMAVNHAHMGKGRHIARNVELDDGFCQITIIPRMRKREAIRTLRGLGQGKVLQDQPCVQSLRVREFKVCSNGGAYLYLLDGDVLMGTGELHVKIIPRGLAVFVPAGTELPTRCTCCFMRTNSTRSIVSPTSSTVSMPSQLDLLRSPTPLVRVVTPV